MVATIVILDDESDRLSAMTNALSSNTSKYKIVTFKNAPEIIDWLRHHQSSASLISLDHDLIPISRNEPDPGSGRDVADYLAAQSPSCHVIIHSTNTMAAAAMETTLAENGWSCSRFCPYNDLEWVTDFRIHEVTKHISHS